MDPFSRLRQVPFLSHLNARQLTELARICARERYLAGEDIIVQGDLSTSFFIVDEGAVHFRQTDLDGFEHPCGSAAPGQFFGIQMFTTQEPSECTAEAVGEAVLYVMERDKFDHLVAAYPALLANLPEIAKKRHELERGYSWLTSGEIIQWNGRRHAITFGFTLLLPVLGALLVLIAYLVISYLRLLGDTTLLSWGVLALMLIFAGWAIYRSWDWFDDDYIITNKRVVHADRHPLYGEMREEIPISQVQQATAYKGGPVEVALGIGTLEVRSAGRQESEILFDSVHDPDTLKELIFRQRGVMRARDQAVQRERFRRRVAGELQHYVLKQPGEQQEPGVNPEELAVVSRRRRFRSWAERLFPQEDRRGDTITWHRHPYVLYKQTNKWLGAIGALVIVLFAYLTVPVMQAIPRGAFLLLYLFGWVVVLGGLWWQWEDWRNDIYKVNDREILDIERQPFGLNERSTVAPLHNVQDVVAEQRTIVHQFFDFGNVKIQMAGAGEPLTFIQVSHPKKIVEEIFRRREALRIRQMERETSFDSRNVVDALVAYHRLLVAERHNGASEPEARPTDEAGLRQLEPGQIEETVESEIIEVETPPDDRLPEFPPVEEE